MELFRPHSLPGVSVAETSYRIPCLLPEIRTSVSFIQPRRRTSHHFPLVSTCASSSSTASSLLYQPPKVSGPSNTRWIVIMEKPPIAGSAKSEIVDYYVETLARVVGSEREAQMCIYDASCESRFGFCCDIDEEWSHELGRLPGVISVLPDSTSEAEKKDYSQPNILLAHHSKSDHSDLKFSPSGKDYVHWLVRLEKPGVETVTKTQMVDYCTHILAKVLRNEKDAQVSIYNISWENDLGFCCQIDEESAKELSDVPGVLSVRPDLSFGSENKNYKVSGKLRCASTMHPTSPYLVYVSDIDEEWSHELGRLPGVISVKPDNTSEAEDYSLPNLLLAHHSKADHSDLKFSPSGKDYVHWLVRLEKPGVEIVTKAQMVDYCTHILAKVLRNEKDAQVSIYNISWENDLGFCCQIDEECAKELSDVPGVLSVRPDLSFASENKNYKVMTDVPLKSNGTPDSSEASMPDVKTKRLFVTGLSFYTSEKTLRAAFEGFGELVEVKVIMDKISKRSKGYAFIEYTTEAAANTAYKEMNGKIINGWMIVVDVARTNPSSSVRSKGRDPTSTVSLN